MATAVGPVVASPGLPGGISAYLDVTAPQVIKAKPGVIASLVCVITGNVTLNDCATTGAAATANQIGIFDMTAGQVIPLNWPCGTGIVLSAVSAGQFSISFS